MLAVKNAEMHQLTVDQLELGEDDCVLEIGFGHGRMIRMMAELRRVLRDGAVLLLALRMHDPDGGSFSLPGFREAQVDGVVAQARAAGFRESKRDVHELSRTVALVRAIR